MPPRPSLLPPKTLSFPLVPSQVVWTEDVKTEPDIFERSPAYGLLEIKREDES